MDATTQKRITIDPITRLEGHGKIDIFLDPQGEVERAYFQVPELRPERVRVMSNYSFTEGFAKGVNVATPGMVGQWQKGEFEVVWPKARATAPLITQKPAWG